MPASTASRATAKVSGSPVSRVGHMSPADADTPPEIAALLEEIGVWETADLPPNAAPGGRANGAAPSQSNLFVRSARNGGSPFLNLVSRLALALSVAGVMGFVYFGYLGARAIYRAMHHTRSTTASLPSSTASGGSPGVVACAPATLGSNDRIPAIREAPNIVLGRKRLPRDPATLQSVHARTQMRGADRVDVFYPVGAQLVVWYAGTSDRVRSVAVILDRPRPFCAALQMAGLLARPAQFTVGSGGVVQPASGSTHAFFRSGIVRIRTDAGGVRTLQLDRR